MIYLRCKYDIISVPSYAEGIYHIEDISPVPQGTDIIVKNLFCQVDKRGFLHGAGSGGRTRTVSLPPDFESGASANSTTPAKLRYILYNTFFKNAIFIFTYVDEKFVDFLCILR